MEKEEWHHGELWPLMCCPGKRRRVTLSFPLDLNLKNHSHALGSRLSSQGLLHGLHKLGNSVPPTCYSGLVCYVSKVSCVLKQHQNV